jgi:putative transposase
MALSFLYLACVRILQLLRLGRRDSGDLAVEVVMLRHEVAVLRRHVARPASRPTDRPLLSELSRFLGRRRRGRFFVESDALLRWYRDLVRQEGDPTASSGAPEHSCGHGGDRPPAGPGEPHLGPPKDPGRMGRMGVVLAPSSIWAILRRH